MAKNNTSEMNIVSVLRYTGQISEVLIAKK